MHALFTVVYFNLCRREFVSRFLEDVDYGCLFNFPIKFLFIEDVVCVLCESSELFHLIYLPVFK